MSQISSNKEQNSFLTFNNDSDEFTLLLSEYENSDEIGKNNITEWKASIHNH